MAKDVIFLIEQLEDLRKYWDEKLSGDAEEIKLCADFEGVGGYCSSCFDFELDEAISAELLRICKGQDLSAFVFLLSAFKILIFKVTGVKDFYISSPVFEGDEMVSNVFLPLRDSLESSMTFKEVLGSIKKTVTEAYENQQYPLDRLPVLANWGKDQGYRIVMLSENIHESIELENDLTFSIRQDNGRIYGKMAFNLSLYREETIKSLCRSYLNILEQIIHIKEIALKDIELVSTEEKKKLLNEFSGIRNEPNEVKPVHQLFEEQSQRTPENTAIFYGDSSLTYKALNNMADLLAAQLREKGVKPGEIVGMMLERSLDLAVGILGILKAGGAYLPIDCEYPAERVEYMLTDSGAGVLITQSYLKLPDGFGGAVINIDLLDSKSIKGKAMGNSNTMEDLAYIIYTSGSTGKPKGVMIEHGSLLNFAHWRIKEYDFRLEDVTIQLISSSFDGFGANFYPALLTGGSIVIPEKEKNRDYEYITRLIKAKGITNMSVVPTMYDAILENAAAEDLESVRFVVLAGEKSGSRLIKASMEAAPAITLINEYGPTENTITSTYLKNMTPSNSSVIGKPIFNNNMYVLGNDNTLMPIGMVGELFTAGKSLARGYLNRPELTNERFLENPFCEGQKMYRTGDLARWLADGNIEYRGRADYQVKIRGYRVELEELENRLLSNQKVKAAIVIDKEDMSNNKYLCAFVVLEDGYSIAQLKDGLINELPDYMLPSAYVKLKSFPLLPNGKIDRKALPDEGTMPESLYEAPKTSTEIRLVEIWEEMLGIKGIGINDNFFKLGGHSLKATTFVSRLQKEFGVKLELKQVFMTPTIKDIAKYIEEGSQNYEETISKVEDREYYPLSPAQRRLYILNQFEASGTAYNMPSAFIFEGALDIGHFEEMLRRLIDRQEVFRTGFEMAGGEPVQKIYKELAFNIEVISVNEVIHEESYRETQTDLKPEMRDLINGFVRPFDLQKAPLFRVGIAKLSEDRHIVIFDMHHIISDGESMGIIIRDIAYLYSGTELQELKIQYKDYSVWQNGRLEANEMKSQKEYWLDIFKEDTPVLNMISDYQRPPVKSFEGALVDFKCSNRLADSLKQLAANTGATMYMVLLAAYNIILSKYTGQEDIVVGSPVAGRTTVDLENLAGIFVNTVAMRNYPCGDKTFIEFLTEVKENSIKAFENQDYQFEELVESLKLKRDMSSNPLFDIMFVMQNPDIGDLEFKNIKIAALNFDNQISKFDIALQAVEENSSFNFTFEYCTKLFKKETIERLANHFINILEKIAANPDAAISELEMITAEEKTLILGDFNDTLSEYPRDKTIQELFEEQVEKTPNNIAVTFEDRKLSYIELNNRANMLARTLRAKGVKPESIVAVILRRSVEMIVSIIAILKAGGAYLPVDPEYPEERIRYMLEDSKAGVLLTQKSEEAIDFKGQKIYVENEEIYDSKDENLETIGTPDNLAYVIYTSGSTGRPKGVMLEHKGIASLQVFFRDDLKINEKDKVLQFASSSFDASVWEIIMALLIGAELNIVSRDIINDLSKMNEFLKENKITVATLPPNYLANMKVDRELPLRKLITAGSTTSHELVNKWISGLEYINAYGPTETTVCATIYRCNGEEGQYKNIPIGKAIKNVNIYILDKNCKLQPVGIPGELCVGGDGLARGYLNRPELTLEKFVPNPYIQDEKLYRTGDLARWLPDGNIEFLGRMDYQVKIRGFRIELGEIENLLLAHPLIKEAVVIDIKDDNNNRFLVAYISAQKDLTVGELRGYLGDKLPDYMIPSYFMQLEKMPITSNGKIDRKALPKPTGDIVTGNIYQAPENETQQKLVAIWQKLLEVEKIGINDSFFELGGDSLKATHLVANIHKEFNVEMQLRDFFTLPTIKQLEDKINESVQSQYHCIERAAPMEYYPLSSAQKRMYLLYNFDKYSTGYNIPYALRLEGSIDRNMLEKAFKQLLTRHEALRTSFEVIGEEIIQRVWKEAKLDVQYMEATGYEEAEKLFESFVKPFDLSKAPLIRVGLVKISEQAHVLMYDMHHIITDGVSMAILTKEFAELYQGNVLKPLTIQYKDYAIWQKGLETGGVLNQQMQFWTSMLSVELPTLNMPLDYPRPSVQSFEGDSLAFAASPETAVNIKNLSGQTGATLYMILLAVYNILLSKYTGQEDIIIGSPIAGRNHGDLENVVGMFVNTLAMRNQPKASLTFLEFLKQVKDNCFSAFQNQDFQFEELVEKLKLPRDLSRNPIFDTLFALQNTDGKENDSGDLKFIPYDFKSSIAKFDITLQAAQDGDSLKFYIEYCTKLFKKETIDKFGSRFVWLLKQIGENPEATISELDIMTDEEKKLILEEFNDTWSQYPRDKTIQQLLEEQAVRVPEQIALSYKEQQLSYREFNEKTNQLARSLREKGVKGDTIVAIMAERSLELIIGITAILKAGGAYMPIDPDYPNDRIRYMLEDSNTGIAIVQPKFSEKLAHIQRLKVVLLENQEMYIGDSAKLENINKPESLAYIMYTSGSTGNPKGVMVEHRNVIRLVKNTNYIEFNEDDRILMTGAIVFDACTFEIWGSLLNGLKLQLIDKEEILDVEKLGKALSENNITILWLTSSLFNQIAQQSIEIFSGLRYLLVGGDVLPAKQINRVLSEYKQLNIINGYGPTENTTFSVCFKIDKEYQDNIPIGKPISNSTAYIVGKDCKPQPIGIPGELCVAGDGLARGYLNQPELTSEKFIQNPFKQGESMYRTGDLARWLPNGNIEFLGRMDYQVKIRGFRIEVGEIENLLLAHPEINEAVVIDKKDENDNKYLAAYFSAQRDMTVAELREYLGDRLPDYMIPSYFVQLDKFPLNQNGKVDRKALPEPNLTAVVQNYEAPTNEIEIKLIQIWEDILSVKGIGINSNFFELGGHSLKATILSSKVHREFGVEIPLKELFVRTTVKQLAEYVMHTDKKVYKAIQPVEKRSYYKLSSAQKRLFIIEQFEGIGTGYNMPCILSIEGELDAKKAAEAFVKLVARHEAFRTSFEMVDGDPVQRIHDSVEFKVDFVELPENKIKQFTAAFIQPFDLSRAPLLRVCIAKITPRQHLLMLDLHHIIADGTSAGIIVSDFMQLYEGRELTEARIQYKDFSEWQNQLLESGEMSRQEEYWLDKLSGTLPKLNMPLDYTRPQVQSFEGNILTADIDIKMKESLNKLALETGSTMFMVLLAAYYVLLSKYSMQEDIIIGSPIAGRHHVDLENTIGMFVNMLALRNKPSKDKSFIEFLYEVRKTALEAYENQDYQFEELVDRLGVKRDPSRNPIVEMVFSMLNMDVPELQIGETKISNYNEVSSISKFDIMLFLSEEHDSIRLMFQYCTKLFDDITIKKLAEHYIKVLEEITKDSSIKLGNIVLLENEEINAILTEIERSNEEVDIELDF